MRTIHRRAFCVFALVGLATLAVGCKKASAPVTITLDKTTYAPGDKIVVTYSRQLTTPAGQQHWITVAPATAPESEFGTWHYTAQGANSDSLVAPAAGPYEVRLHDLYPKNASKIIAKQAITVVSPAVSTVGLALTVTRPIAKAGESVTVTFGRPLQPPAGQQYWIALVKASEPDDQWGDWHYIAANATSDVVTPSQPGAYEVRLHDYYPLHPSGILARKPLIVQ